MYSKFIFNYCFMRSQMFRVVDTYASCIMGFGTLDKCKLYIRYPSKIEDEFVIRNLHPNIVGVHLPRQKSRHWCIVDFESQEKLQEAKTALQKVIVQGKVIKFRPYRQKVLKKVKLVKKPIQKSSEVSTKSLEKLLKNNS